MPNILSPDVSVKTCASTTPRLMSEAPRETPILVYDAGADSARHPPMWKAAIFKKSSQEGIEEWCEDLGCTHADEIKLGQVTSDFHRLEALDRNGFIEFPVAWLPMPEAPSQDAISYAKSIRAEIEARLAVDNATRRALEAGAEAGRYHPYEKNPYPPGELADLWQEGFDWAVGGFRDEEGGV